MGTALIATLHKPRPASRGRALYVTAQRQARVARNAAMPSWGSCPVTPRLDVRFLLLGRSSAEVGAVAERPDGTRFSFLLFPTLLRDASDSSPVPKPLLPLCSEAGGNHVSRLLGVMVCERQIPVRWPVVTAKNGSRAPRPACQCGEK